MRISNFSQLYRTVGKKDFKIILAQREIILQFLTINRSETVN